MGGIQYTVEGLSPLTLCVLERLRLNNPFIDHQILAYDLTWIAASEARLLDRYLLRIGRRTALERTAYLITFLYRKAKAVNLIPGETPIPVTQQHVSDTLDLSIVHTEKTLRKLVNHGLIRWTDKSCLVLDDAGLGHVAGVKSERKRPRPFI